MIRVVDGHEVFGQLQLKWVDWRQEMFTEEEESERENEDGAEGGQDWNAVKLQKSSKATSSGQPMEVTQYDEFSAKSRTRRRYTRCYVG